MMGSERNPGVIPLAMADVFKTIKNVSVYESSWRRDKTSTAQIWDLPPDEPAYSEIVHLKVIWVNYSSN